MEKYECENCGCDLSDQELERYDEEFAVWARKHPGWQAGIDIRDRHEMYSLSGVRVDCNSCAVERLRLQKEIAQSTTFLERAAQGGPEGFVIVAVMIGGLLLIAFAR